MHIIRPNYILTYSEPAVPTELSIYNTQEGILKKRPQMLQSTNKVHKEIDGILRNYFKAEKFLVKTTHKKKDIHAPEDWTISTIVPHTKE